MQYKPAALCRKIIEIAPDLAILWSGDYNAARVLATRAQEWLTAPDYNKEDLRRSLDTYYRERIPEFNAIIAPSSEHWFYTLGSVQKGASPSYGEYAVAGSGVEVFRAFADEIRRPEGDASPDLIALKLANDLVTREITTSETIYSGFGGGYEIFYRDVRGFGRVDDVMRFFIQVKSDNEGALQVAIYPHATRQWYEGDRLYIVSLSSRDAAQEGFGSVGYIVPSILGEELEPRRSTEELATRPKYLCIYQQFQFREMQIPSTLALRGDTIDRYFKIAKDGDGIRWGVTSMYTELLHRQWDKIVNTLPN